jgi:hypothetical protein
MPDLPIPDDNCRGWNDSEFRILGSRVIRANMRRKFSIALQLEVAHHFIEGIAGGRFRSLEPPATFRAAKASKTRLLNPYQLPNHGGLYRCLPTLSDNVTATRLPSMDAALSLSQGPTP